MRISSLVILAVLILQGSGAWSWADAPTTQPLAVEQSRTLEPAMPFPATLQVIATQPAATQPMVSDSAATKPTAVEPRVPVLPAPQPEAKPSGDSRPTAKTVTIPKRDFQRYQVLEDRNIFLRGGVVRTRSFNGLGGSARPASGGRRWTLTGTILRAGNPVAFLESSETGTTQRFEPGQDTPIGTIAQVGMDYVLLRDSSQAIQRLEIGQSVNVDGGYASSGSTAPATASNGMGGSSSEALPNAVSKPESSGASSSDAPAGSDAAAILERLRARRAQEMGR